MKKLYILLTLLPAIAWTGCSDFLEETPNKTGSAYIYHMDQLIGLTGNYSLYTAGYSWTESISLSDAIDYTPYYVKLTGRSGGEYRAWHWDRDYYETECGVGTSWTPNWNAIFTFNTVLENMDKVIQTTVQQRKQVEGEARFGRAYFHFIILVQYALWDESAPGIGYRTSTLPTDIPARETVGYTLEKIYEDLDLAETLLTEAGRTTFEPKRNFRPTVPTVKSLRARIDLYRGKYSDALKNAEAALAGHNELLDFKNDELYEIDETDDIYLLNANNQVTGTIRYHKMTKLQGKGREAFWNHPEFYLPHHSDLYYNNRNLPISESYYNLFDHENDERWIRFYNNNHNVYTLFKKSITLPGDEKPTPYCFTLEDQQGIGEPTRHAYVRFVSSSGSSGKLYLVGMTTAEMYLIKAECLAREGKTAEAAQVLKTLRRTRFTTNAVADNIGGTLQEVLDERAREMTELWRFFDIKRLNGADKAGIKIKRTILTTPTDINSTSVIEISPDDPAWAIPINYQQTVLMGWEQN